MKILNGYYVFSNVSVKLSEYFKKETGQYYFSIIIVFIINSHVNGTPEKLCAHVEIFPS